MQEIEESYTEIFTRAPFDQPSQETHYTVKLNGFGLARSKFLIRPFDTLIELRSVMKYISPNVTQFDENFLCPRSAISLTEVFRCNFWRILLKKLNHLQGRQAPQIYCLTLQ